MDALGGMIRQAGQHVREPSLWIDVVELGGSDEGVDRSSTPAALIGDAHQCRVGESVYLRRTRAPRPTILKSSRISATYAERVSFLGQDTGQEIGSLRTPAGAARIRRR